MIYAKVVFQDPANGMKETESEITEWEDLFISKGAGLYGGDAHSDLMFQCGLDHLVSVDFERPKE